MLCSRSAALAVGATVLGLTVALVPAVSNAADPVATPTATPIVTWADSASDFTAVSLSFGATPLPAGWSFVPDAAGADGSSDISDAVTFDASGISAKQGKFVPLLRRLSAPVSPDDLPALVATATANVGSTTRVGLLLSKAAAPTVLDNTVDAPDGFVGTATTWSGNTGAGRSTADLAAELRAEDEVVSGYYVVINSSSVVLDEQQDVPDGAEQLRTAPATTGTRATTAVRPAAGTTAVRAAAVTPAANGAASIAVGDTTTYFTPQPTAAMTLATTSATVSAATTTGVPFTATGFAPGEAVTAAIGTATPLADSFVADADGAVSGTLLVPSASVPAAGRYALTLVGSSSQQSAQAVVTITADPAAPAPGPITAPAPTPVTTPAPTRAPAPVADPVTGRATFTG